MVINFKIAIYIGFLVAILFSVFPAILKRKSLKEFIPNFILSFIGIIILVFMTSLLLDLQMSSPEFINPPKSSPERLKRREAGHSMDGHFIYLNSVLMPSNKRS
jgi:ABC-type uncharacterized transport system permease subunit